MRKIRPPMIASGTLSFPRRSRSEPETPIVGSLTSRKTYLSGTLSLLRLTQQLCQALSRPNNSRDATIPICKTSHESCTVLSLPMYDFVQDAVRIRHSICAAVSMHIHIIHIPEIIVLKGFINSARCARRLLFC